MEEEGQLQGVDSKTLPVVKEDPCNSMEQENSTTSTGYGCAAAIKKDLDDRLIDDLLESSDDSNGDDSDVEVFEFEPPSVMEKETEQKGRKQHGLDEMKSDAGNSDEDTISDPDINSTSDCDQKQMVSDVDHSDTEEAESVKNTSRLETGNNNRGRSSVDNSGTTQDMDARRSSQELELARAQISKLDDKVKIMEWEISIREKRDEDYTVETSRLEGRIEELLRVQGELEETIETHVKRHLEEKQAIGELKNLFKPMKIKVVKLKTKVAMKEMELKEMRLNNLKKDNVDVEEELRLNVQILEEKLAQLVDKLEVERTIVKLNSPEMEQKDVRNHELLDNLQTAKDCTDKEITRNKVLTQQLRLKDEEELKIKEELLRANNKIQGLEIYLLKTEGQVIEMKKANTKVHEQVMAERECRVKSKELTDLHRQLTHERQKANEVLSNLIDSDAKLNIERTRIKEFEIVIKQHIEDGKRNSTKLDITEKEVESLELKLEEKNIELADKVDRLTRFSLESIGKDSKISELVKNKEALENKSLRELSDEVEALDRQLQEEKMS